MLVIFNHGKESGPWGRKIKVLAKTAEALGFSVISVDYQGIDDPDQRVEKLTTYIEALTENFLLVGSSMGGYVATVAAAKTKSRGLFLMAPAFYLGGQANFDELTPPCETQIVHGWKDDIVPVENSWRYAERTRAELHLVNDGHRLIDSLPQTNALFKRFLETLLKG